MDACASRAACAEGRTSWQVRWRPAGLLLLSPLLGASWCGPPSYGPCNPYVAKGSTYRFAITEKIDTQLTDAGPGSPAFPPSCGASFDFAIGDHFAVQVDDLESDNGRCRPWHGVVSSFGKIEFSPGPAPALWTSVDGSPHALIAAGSQARLGGGCEGAWVTLVRGSTGADFLKQQLVMDRVFDPPKELQAACGLAASNLNGGCSDRYLLVAEGP
jgi:hypothetical protein